MGFFKSIKKFGHGVSKTVKTVGHGIAKTAHHAENAVVGVETVAGKAFSTKGVFGGKGLLAKSVSKGGVLDRATRKGGAGDKILDTVKAPFDAVANIGKGLGNPIVLIALAGAAVIIVPRLIK